MVKRKLDDDKELVLKYYKELANQAKNIDEVEFKNAIKILRKAKQKGNMIYICGNGGSSSTAKHMANDLMKIGGAKAISLTNLPLITAYSNDVSYDDIFLEQLKLLMRKGDVVIGITGSGNSENVINALRYANQNGGTPIAILGFDGGKLIDMKIDSILINSRDYGIIEDIHLSIGHVFAKALAGKDVII